MPDELLSTKDITDRYGVSPSTVSRRVKAGALTPVARIDGPRGAMFFAAGDVEAEFGPRAAEAS